MEEMKNEVMEQEVVQEEPYKSGSVHYIDSRDVAEMVGKEHSKLLKDIRRYMAHFNEAKIGSVDFWVESTYVDAKGESRTCYLVTEKGCEFIAHKLTGQKGSEFTARYIDRFHEMKGALEEQTDGAIRKFIEQQMETNRIQAEFNQVVMDKLESLNGGRARWLGSNAEGSFLRHINHEFDFDEQAVIEENKKELCKLTKKVAGLCGVPHNSILHQIYKALEERLGIDLDAYRSVYRSETGNQNAGMIEVISAHTWIFESAVDLCEYVIEKKNVFD